MIDSPMRQIVSSIIYNAAFIIRSVYSDHSDVITKNASRVETERKYTTRSTKSPPAGSVI